MRIFSFVLIVSVFCTVFRPATAQAGRVPTDSVTLQGKVSDSFTRENLVDVDIVITDSNGFTVTTRTFLYKAMQSRFDRRYFQTRVPHAGKYLVTFTKEGYEPKSVTVDIPEKKYMRKVTFWETEEVLLRRSGNYSLKEATVTASRIMMVERGDTIVYNASAFQLSEGSMLDALVAQLPGVKLEDGGRITVNGHFVKDLLVNGKDFFRGDPKVALDNLPAYMVSNIKAYQREPDDAYLSGFRTAAMRKQDPWVIDVTLKRQYAQGWIANAEAAYGTDDRHSERFFGLRFTGHSRLALYGSDNNINRQGRPGNNGDWAEEDHAANGDVGTRQGGMMFSIDGKKTKIKFDTSLQGIHSTDHTVSHGAATQFLTGRNVYGRSFSGTRTKEADVKWQAHLSVPLKRVAIHFSPEMSYHRSRRSARYLKGTWNDEPAEQYRGAAIDSLFSINAYREKSVYANSDTDRESAEAWRAGGLLRMKFKSPLLGRTTTFYLMGNVGRDEGDAYSQYLLRTTATRDKDFRNRYTDQGKRSYRWMTRMEYNLYGNRRVRANLYYQYEQTYESDARSLFRLDRLKDSWAVPEEEGGHRLGLLPSTRDSLSMATDWQNAYRSLLMTGTHRPELDVNVFFKNGGTLQFSLPLSVKSRNIRDFRHDNLSRRTAFSRRTVTLEPNAMYFSPKGLTLSYSRRFIPAPLTSMIDVRDDSNPLYIHEGNTDLKDTWEDNLSISYRLSDARHRQMLYAQGHLWMQTNSVGLARSYNTGSGVTVVTPENMNGN